MPPAPDKTLKILHKGLEMTMGRKIAEIETLKSSVRQSSSIRVARVTFADQDTMHLWAKTLRGARDSMITQDRTARDFDLHKLLYAVFEADGPFRVPRPLFHSPEDRLIVTEHCGGYRLQDKIERLARGFPRAEPIRELQQDCLRAGLWLQAFQAATREHAPGVAAGLDAQPLMDFRRVVALTSERFKELVTQIPSARGPLQSSEILNFLDKRLASTEPDSHLTCSIHGDFFPGNLLVHRRAVCGIDFSSATWGSPWFDPSYFVFQLETLTNKPWFRRKTVTALIDTFLDGYGSSMRHHNFWRAAPGMEILHFSHSIARLLSLSKSTHQLNLKAIYRRYLMRGLVQTLSTHLRSQV